MAALNAKEPAHREVTGPLGIDLAGGLINSLDSETPENTQATGSELANG
jgi:hypothetical protein